MKQEGLDLSKWIVAGKKRWNRELKTGGCFSLLVSTVMEDALCSQKLLLDCIFLEFKANWEMLASAGVESSKIKAIWTRKMLTAAGS